MFPTILALMMTDELTLFLILLIGLIAGQWKVQGFQLGLAGIIFAGLVAGHFGASLPAGTGTIGMILFVYCLGIGAGPGFFRTLGNHGISLAIMGSCMILSAAAVVYGFSRLAGVSADLATGLFAGALTSTPALATVSEYLPGDSQLAVGFGMAYPFGTFLVILFVQLYPRFFPAREIHLSEGTIAVEGDAVPILRVYVEVTNPALSGKKLSDVRLLEEANCQISRVRSGDLFRPIPADFALQTGQQLLIVGSAHDVRCLVDLFGQEIPEADDTWIAADTMHRRRVVITSSEMIGKSLKELHLRSRMGITITRIHRHDVEFVPDAAEEFHRGDAVTAIGEKEQLDQFMVYAGHRERTYIETDLVSLTSGILLGLLLGMLEFRIAGTGFSLGKAGGPLIVGLLLGHLGRLGPITGHFPAASRLLLTDLGLALFLADSGVKAGRDFVQVLSVHGPVLIIGGIVITITPLIVGALIGRYMLKFHQPQLLGGACGAMTSTPGLGALMSSDGANVAVRSYASIYPLALIMMSLLAPLLLAALNLTAN